jgi:hypothetical protein
MRFPISLLRFTLVWVSMAVAMSANGVFRELILKRVTTSTVANVLSAGLGILLIALITRVGFRPLGPGESLANLAALSLALVLLTVVFETVLGRVVDHKSWSELAAHYALWRGELWPIVLAFLAVTPFLWAHRFWAGR